MKTLYGVLNKEYIGYRFLVDEDENKIRLFKKIDVGGKYELVTLRIWTFNQLINEMMSSE
jgi:hypothetical protein